MLDILLNFEKSAGFLNPNFLLSFGIVILATGIAMWLAGMALRRFFMLIIAAGAGAAAGLHFYGKPAFAALFAGVLAALSIFLNRFFVIILAALIAILIASSILIWNFDTQLSLERGFLDINSPLNSKQTVLYINQFLFKLYDHAKQVSENVPYIYWLVIPFLIVLIIAGGIFFWSLISAWCWSTIGTILIFAGLISLLFYKGSFPVTLIFHNSTFYTLLFCSMMGGGAIIQLVLFHEFKSPIKKHEEKEDPQTKPKPKRWRGL